MTTAPFRVEYAEGDFLVVSRGEVKAFINRGHKRKLFKVRDNAEIALAFGECSLSFGKLLLGSKSSCILWENSSEN